MNPVDIINEYYKPESKAHGILISHGESVARKALDVAQKVRHLNPDLEFIREAAMLHDIGIFLTHSHKIGCYGKHPYVCHGYLGRELLEDRNLHRHAMVCERHVGTGITAEDIENHNLPLPVRDMIPVSIEEQIICYADKFFSKDGLKTAKEKPMELVLRSLARYGPKKLVTFQKWSRLFGE